MSESISRRAMLQRSAGGAITASLSALLLSCRDTDLKLAQPTWLSGGFDQAAIIAIGRRYLVDHPDEDDIAILAGQVGRSLRGAWPWSPDHPLVNLVAAEFEAGDTVLVDGWMLARTEARLCAAVAYEVDRTAKAT